MYGIAMVPGEMGHDMLMPVPIDAAIALLASEVQSLGDTVGGGD